MYCEYFDSKFVFIFTKNIPLNHITHFQGDYFRLGHGSDQHLRKPTPIQGLRGKKVVHVAVGALHCLAVTDTGEVSFSQNFEITKAFFFI